MLVFVIVFDGKADPNGSESAWPAITCSEVNPRAGTERQLKRSNKNAIKDNLPCICLSRQKGTKIGPSITILKTPTKFLYRFDDYMSIFICTTVWFHFRQNSV